MTGKYKVEYVGLMGWMCTSIDDPTLVGYGTTKDDAILKMQSKQVDHVINQASQRPTTTNSSRPCGRGCTELSVAEEILPTS